MPPILELVIVSAVLGAIVGALVTRRLLRPADPQRHDRLPGTARPAPASDFFTEASHREEWREYLAGFDREVYPLFSPFGITRGEALITWQINRIRNALYDLAADPDDDAPWKAES